MRSLLLLAIALYRFAVSPMLPRACRFTPTCSNFAYEAVKQHGSLKGIALALARIARCHPWTPGGLDPVPPPRKGSRLCR